MKLHLLTILCFGLLLSYGCGENTQTVDDPHNGNDEINLAPNEGEDCDFRKFTPFCSSDHKAVNCSTFDGFSVEKCKEDEECLIGVTEGFHSKKPDAGCYKPCTADDIDKEISICEDDENRYYKCESFGGKYYYSDYSSSILCDRGCNNEGTDCIKISDKEYEVCDIDNPDIKNICDENIRLECGFCRRFGCDVIIYNAFDCEADGKICVRGQCVEKHVDDEFDHCDDSYKPRCENGYQVMCGYSDYVVATKCDEETECLMIDNEISCLKPCAAEEIGKIYTSCDCWGSCSTLSYECKEVSVGNYYYQLVDADSCPGYCNEEHTACAVE